jgi:hypothetical protein
MVDDLLQLVSSASPNAANSWAKGQAELNLDIRNDLAAALGGEGALALDGPLLPTPSWKLIVEVNDPSRLQYSIGKLIDARNREAQQSGGMVLKLEELKVDGNTFYTVHSTNAQIPLEVHYAFSGAYLVAAPSQALVQAAIATRASGEGISHSDRFHALFPSDQHANVSGVIYQNLAPTIAPIAGQLSATQMQSLQSLVFSRSHR